MPSSTIRYTGAADFRQRILLATLPGRPVRIDGIRSDEAEVGLRDFEASFLRLVEKVVNGCEVVINETGTALRYKPGIIVGGEGLVHDCGTSRAVGYFVQPLLVLAAFTSLNLGAVRFPSVLLPLFFVWGLGTSTLFGFGHCTYVLLFWC